MTFRSMRKCAGFKTQEDLATFMEVTRAAVAKWESGVAYPHPSKIPKLAELYGVTSDDIINTISASRTHRESSA